MPLTTYTAGEVLTAASLNANFTFAAANPLGGFVRTGGGSVGSSSSVTYTGCFSATYTAYKIIGSNLSSTTDADTLTFTIANNSTNYFTTRYYTSSGGVTITVDTQANAAANSGGGLIVSDSAGGHMDMTINNPFAAARTTYFAQTTPADATFYMQMMGRIENATSGANITFTLAGGTFAGGQYDIYGLTNS